jgi:hypothetical protein
MQAAIIFIDLLVMCVPSNTEAALAKRVPRETSTIEAKTPSRAISTFCNGPSFRPFFKVWPARGGDPPSSLAGLLKNDHLPY